MSDSPEVPESTEAAPKPEKMTMDIVEIMAILPHRYPLLLIDRVIEMERKTRIVAIKNVTANEPHFIGHFPDFPIMPGVLIVEAIAQAGGALLLTEIPDRDDKLMVFTGIEGAKFRRAVVPGDQLRLNMTKDRRRGNVYRFNGVARVDGVTVAEASLGAKVDVPTIDGRAQLKIPPATQSGQKLRMRERGVESAQHPGQRGDQIVTVEVVVPHLQDERSREIMRELAKLNNQDPRVMLFDKM